MLVSQTNPVGVELFSYVNAFFCANKFAQMLTTWVKTLYITNFFTRIIAYSGDFLRKVIEGPFWCKFYFLLNVRVHMELENNASE